MTEEHSPPEISVRFEPSGRVARVAPGTTLLAAAAWADVPVASTCGGFGTCGECRVRILEGRAPVADEDRDLLSPGLIGEGWRLACRHSLHGDATCAVDPLPSHPRAAVEGLRRAIVVEPLVRVEEAEGAPSVVHGSRVLAPWPSASRAPLGVAFDLGTTTAAAVLVDLADGRDLARASRVNRQASVGADVITRAAYAHDGPEATRTLQGMAVGTLNELVDALCREAGASPTDVFEAVVTGNAIMLHLLVGMDPHPLAVAPFRTLFREPRDLEASELGLAIHPRGRVVTFPLVGAYAGGDTVAGLHATGVVRGEAPGLLVDLGTNTEVAVGWGGSVVVASAPAGPAFEGAGIRRGSPAVPGAVAHVEVVAGGAGALRRPSGAEVRPARSGLPSDGPPDDLRLDVIGELRPTGICGTGLVDLLAELRRVGLLDATGRLASAAEAPGHPLSHRLATVGSRRSFRVTGEIVVSQGDIRELQAAVAAVAAAVRIVLHHAELRPEDLADVFLAGSFGAALDPTSARALGLVPEVDPSVVRSVGNAALEGARAALLSFREREAAFQIPDHAEYVELSGHPLFNDAFLEAMAFPG
ncbi:MAG: ASKHA domain-containing protein [Gemmatimonadetes bacterium]|nr:ASKHA domain-containing protein [Gemmatimonadota bacterium]